MVGAEAYPQQEQEGENKWEEQSMQRWMGTWEAVQRSESTAGFAK